jgi:hypothetical protein
LLSVVSCCLLGSRILSGKGASVLKVILYGETGSGMHSHSREAVVDPGNDLSYFNYSGRWTKHQQKGPSSGALVVEHSILLPKQHPLVYKGAWVLSG